MTAQRSMLMSPAKVSLRLDWRLALLPFALWAAYQTYCANQVLEVQLAQDISKFQSMPTF